MNDFKIIANIASFPERINLLEKSVSSILSQVDELNVYLNDYSEVPNFLRKKKINAILSKYAAGDLKDNGKFYFLDKYCDDVYYFTIDDDIIYPNNYVSQLLECLNKYNNKVVVGVHGIIFHEKFKSFRKTRTSFHFEDKLEYDMFVSTVGTGTLVFQKNVLKDVTVGDFTTVGMSDLWFASFCKKNNIPLVCIQREKYWLKNINTENNAGYTLWNEARKNEKKQNDIIRGNKLWELNVEGLEKYRCHLESKLLQLSENIENQKNNEFTYKNEIDRLKNSKSLLLGKLIFETFKKPFSFLFFPFRLLKIILK